MLERSTFKPAVSFLNSSLTWQPRRLFAVSGQLCRVADLAILGTVFLSVVVLPHNGPAHAGFSELLGRRVALRDVLLSVVCIAVWRVLLLGMGVYSPKRTRSFLDYSLRCIIGLNICTLTVGVLVLVLYRTLDVWAVTEVFWVLCLAAMVAVRSVCLLYADHLRPKLRPRRNLMIVGSGPRARQVFEEFKAHTEWDYQLLGFVDSEPQSDFVPPELILGGIGELEQILMHTVVDEVVIALPIKSQYVAVEDAIGICQSLGVQAQYFTDFFGTSVTKRHSSAGPQTGRVVLEAVYDDSRRYIKRMVDIVSSAVLLVLLVPVLLAVAVAVKLTSPGPILFRQERFGLNKRRFYMLKFRSMMVDAESRQAAIEHLNELSGPTFKIKNDPRLTPIGSFLRKYSLDELPQLLNVLAGQMSLVGPRPLPLRDVKRFSEAWLMRRFSVKPGITCLWQIGGRSNTDFDRWIALDLKYIDEWSLSLDLEILLKTLPAVLTSRGAS